MTTRKVLLVGIDGLRIDDALRPGAAPELAAFVAAGGITRMTMEVPTISGPGWSSLLTGSPHAVHGVFDNTFRGHAIPEATDLLSRASAADPATTTFAATSWPPILDPAGPGPIVAFREDAQRGFTHRVVIRDGEVSGYRWADGEVAAASVLALRDWGPDASFVYLGAVDEAGHLHGGTSPEYAAAILQVDAQLGRLLTEVERRAVSQDEDWLVAVTTDHGHLDEGGHGGPEDVVRGSFLALRRYGGDGVPRPESLEPTDVVGLLLGHRED